MRRLNSQNAHHIAAFGIICFLAVNLISCDSTVKFSAFFKDAKTLKKGDPLVLSGITIGTVADILPSSDGRVEVKMRLQEKHKGITNASSIAFIENSRGRNQVELYPLDKSAGPIEEGDRIEGIDSNLELQFRLAKAKIVPTLSSLASQIALTTGKIQDYLDSPEGRRQTRETYEFLLQAKEWTTKEFSDFRQKHPEFEKNLKKQIDIAKRQGNKALLRLLQEIEKNLQESESSVPTGDGA